jgi:hypothetical protein
MGRDFGGRVPVRRGDAGARGTKPSPSWVALFAALSLGADKSSDIGLKPGSDAQPANRALLQAALDAAEPDSTITLPRGRWEFDRPIHLVDAVTLRGERGTVLVFPQSVGLIAGFPRKSNQVPGLPASVVFDSTAKLDGSAGRRIGLELVSGVQLSSNGGPFQSAQGDFWKGRTQFTIDLKFDATDAPKDSGFTLGMSRYGRPQPFQLVVNPPTYAGPTVLLMIGGVSAVDGKTSTFGWAFDAPGISGASVHDLQIQVDLASCKVGVWLDRKALTTRDGNAGFTVARKLTFPPNRRLPLVTNSLGPRAASVQSDSWTLPKVCYLRLLGLAVSEGLRYGWGNDLTRLDATPLTDLATYFREWSPVVAMLPLQDDMDLVRADRCLAVRLGTQADGVYGWGSALLLSKEHASPSANTGMIGLENLTVVAAGDAFVIGNVLYGDVRGCDFRGGEGGMASWNSDANYTWNVSDTRAIGVRDSAFYLYYAMARLSNTHVESAGRCAYWFDRSYVRSNGAFVGAGGHPECYVRLSGGCNVTLDGTSIDEEAGPAGSLPSEAGIVAEASGQNGSSLGARIILRDFNIGDFNKKIALVKLREESGSPKALLDLSGLSTSGSGNTPMRGLVDCDDYSRWTIRLDNAGVEGWPKFVAPLLGQP